MGFGDWVGRGMSDDFREEFRRGNPEYHLLPGQYYVLKYFRSFEWDLKQNVAQYRVNYADINEPQTP